MLPYTLFGPVVTPLAILWRAISFPPASLLRFATGFLTPKLPEVDLTDQVMIVTGSNTGIGKQTALHLARMGATVVMACRSLERAIAAKAEIEATIRGGERGRSFNIPTGTGISRPEGGCKGGLEVMHLDLGDLTSVNRFVKEFKDRYTRLDVLVNNAGLNGKGLTADGFDATFGVNFLGHFALTMELMPLITATPRSRYVVLCHVLLFS
ncbi:unnamed protein product [Choristocarpus tenellus]